MIGSMLKCGVNWKNVLGVHKLQRSQGSAIAEDCTVRLKFCKVQVSICRCMRQTCLTMVLFEADLVSCCCMPAEFCNQMRQEMAIGK